MSSLEAAVVGSIALFTLRSITCRRSGHTLRQQALGLRRGYPKRCSAWAPTATGLQPATAGLTWLAGGRSPNPNPNPVQSWREAASPVSRLRLAARELRMGGARSHRPP